VSIPLDLLADTEDNGYELTCVAIRNAEKITKKGGDEEISEKGEKIVSVSLAQVLHNSVKYERAKEE